MVHTLEWVKRRLKSQGFQLKYWNDIDGEKLLRSKYPDLIESWNHILSAKKSSIGARKGDFLRVVLLHEFGGIYIDTDMIPCGGLDFLIGGPGVASFPRVLRKVKAINNAVMSAPPKHPVLAHALEMWKKMGERIGADGLLDKTGPQFIALVVDDFLASKNIKFPSISRGELLPYSDGLDPDDFWINVTSMRLGRKVGALPKHVDVSHGLIDLHFGTWFSDKFGYCESHVDMIDPFLDGICTPPVSVNAAFRQCGAEAKGSLALTAKAKPVSKSA